MRSAARRGIIYRAGRITSKFSALCLFSLRPTMVREHTAEEILFRDELTRNGVAILVVSPPPIANMHPMNLHTAYNPTGSTVNEVIEMMARDVAAMVAEPSVFIRSFSTETQSPTSASVAACVVMHHH